MDRSGCPDDLEIGLGLSEEYRYEAAERYYEASSAANDAIMGSRRHAVAILSRDISLARHPGGDSAGTRARGFGASLPRPLLQAPAGVVL